MSSTLALEGLIAAAAAGDHTSFRELYRVVAGRLYAVIVHICRDRRLAEDILQDVFLRIWRGSDRFDAERGAPLAWMSAVARNAALDACRKRARTPEPAGDFDEMVERGEIEPPYAVPAGLSTLPGCLDCLPPHQRECVLLAYVGGFTREDLAARFDRPVGTIKVWLHRGLARLRACLDEA